MEFGITFDCADAPRLARFWARALGYVEALPPEGWDTWEQFLTDYDVPAEEWADGAAIAPPDGEGPRVSFLRVPESKMVKNRIHLDLKVSGGRHLDQALREQRIRDWAAELVSEGAAVLSEEWADGHLDHLVMADPEGNEFCIV